MLNVLRIDNYQSLRKVRLELGKLTVITGATGAGKSAVIRAMRLLAFNARGTSYISKGQKTCQVLVFDDAIMQGVAIARGSRGADGYAISDPSRQENEQVFTKLGGAVPAEVTSWLGLSELNFASQFDAPFLLAESGAKVAAALGRLTNVTLLFSAAREANRRRMRVRDRLDGTQSELVRLQGEIQRYAGLQERSDVIAQAEAALARVDAVEARWCRLGELLRHLSVAQYRAEMVPAPVVLPSFECLDGLLARAQHLRRLLEYWIAARDAVQQWKAEEAHQAAVGQEADARLRQLLASAGICPLCERAMEGT